jgi:Leucine-rich repeat (LRR) protein
MFPEDYAIGKDRLIWMWIAENFIQCDKAGACAFEIGEAFFNELVNRNMIIPVYDDDDDGTTTKGCQVHDMVLDLIYSLSSEVNFVTVLNGTAHSMSSRSNVRRLSLQNAIKGELQTTPLGSVSMLQVRSIATYETAIDLMPSFSRFVALRVLDLSDCDLSHHDHLNLRELGSLLHLRYLGLANTGSFELPKEIGNLQFLQVLDVRGNVFMEVPSTVIKLKRLMCLLVDLGHKLPDGLGNLTSLEVLTEMCCFTASTVKELGCMVRLRKLGIQFEAMSLEIEENFVESLGKMSNIQSIEITHASMYEKVMDILGERWVAPRSLQKFNSGSYTAFSILPAWIRPHLSQLCTLIIWVKEVRAEDLNILGSLPGLSYLDLRSDRQSRLLPVSADGFPCLTVLNLESYSPGHVVVQPGALPKLQNVTGLGISLRVAKEEAAGNVNSGVWFDLNIQSLPSLQYFFVFLHRSGVTVREAKQEEAALEKALRAHPNRPIWYKIYFRPEIPSGT